MDLGESSPISEPERGCPSTMTCHAWCCAAGSRTPTQHTTSQPSQPLTYHPTFPSNGLPRSRACCTYLVLWLFLDSLSLNERQHLRSSLPPPSPSTS